MTATSPKPAVALRLVTWNCAMAFARKAERLFDLSPDIAAVQECGKDAPVIAKAAGYSGLWWGENPSKGLAVFAREPWHIKAFPVLYGKWLAPVKVAGPVRFNLLAVWACTVGKRRADNYIGQVYRCVCERTRFFNTRPVILGDLNSNTQFDPTRPGRNHTEVVRRLTGYGLTSAYHAYYGEAQGSESRPTH